MATRRRKKYAWFPGLGQGRSSASEFNVYNHRFATLTTSANLENNLVFPIAADEGEDEDPAEGPATFLNDSLGQDYVIERIVGNCYVACQQIASEISSMTAVLGIFVGPKTPGAPTQALGASDTTTYSPTVAMNMDQPWMFRRSWNIGNLASQESPGSKFGLFPPTNALSMDLVGPSIDIRTVRRVHKNERLWAVWSVINTWEFETIGEDPIPQVAFSMDLRILGALRRARNKSVFTA